MAAEVFPYRIVVSWSAEDDAYLAHVPSLGVTAHGDSESTAAHEARAAADLAIESLRANSLPVPEAEAAALAERAGYCSAKKAAGTTGRKRRTRTK